VATTVAVPRRAALGISFTCMRSSPLGATGALERDQRVQLGHGVLRQPVHATIREALERMGHTPDAVVLERLAVARRILSACPSSRAVECARKLKLDRTAAAGLDNRSRVSRSMGEVLHQDGCGRSCRQSRRAAGYRIQYVGIQGLSMGFVGLN
jgi:hypothetical protein